jgi:glycosyltransferase involved in cell wall biosynthesis
MRVLINATNLHSGGALQAASSLLLELSKNLNRASASYNFFVFASSEVNSCLADLDFDPASFDGYEVYDVTPAKALRPSVRRKFDGYDLVLTIFGPMYFLRRLKHHIVGFAQPWIIYPDNLLRKKLSLFSWLMYRIKYEIQWIFFKKSECLIVELAHVKARLSELRKYPSLKISIIENATSPIFKKSNLWQEIEGELIGEDKETIKIGYLCRDYPHKNLDFLADVAAKLKEVSSKQYQFYVTLNDNEWRKKSVYFKKFVKNIGEISLAQCPKFYSSLNATIFPSLLECYSAMPIESFLMKVPVFASDLDFIHDCCHNHAVYFDPLDSNSAALEIDNWFSNKSLIIKNKRINDAFKFVNSITDSKARALSYLAIIENFIKIRGG